MLPTNAKSDLFSSLPIFLSFYFDRKFLVSFYFLLQLFYSVRYFATEMKVHLAQSAVFN